MTTIICNTEQTTSHYNLSSKGDWNYIKRVKSTKHTGTDILESKTDIKEIANEFAKEYES